MSSIRVSEKETKRKELDISVLIATYNRADILQRTLKSMTGLDHDGLSVEFVVVDNNSSDHTKHVIESFKGSLPIRYVFEPRTGKNCALNRALDEAPLGKLVVFTDDDVKPRNDWLKAIVRISDRWPNYKVFGGKQYLIYPKGIEVPRWAYQSGIQHWGYALHDWADSDTPYPYGPEYHPSGGNLWVRREIFEEGRRYDESMGPRPFERFPMGSEAIFAVQLAREGFGIMYSPDAAVGHQIQPSQLSSRYIAKRAFRHGKGLPHLRGIGHTELLDKSTVLWYLHRICACGYWIARYGLAKISFLRNRRIEKSTDALRWLAYHMESLRMMGQFRNN